MTDDTSDEILDDLNFELIIGDAGGQIDNGDVPIRWCMKPEFVEQLKERKIVDPHVLITSNHPNKDGKNFYHEMDRKLVPLSELMTYVRFTRAGKCKVYGVLLDGSDGRKQLHNKWMRKQSGDYENIVDSWDDELYPKLEYSVATTSEFVEIPANVFGKEPSPWIKWYVNLWHDSHSRVTDECDFRKRFMIAFIFKWIVFLPFITCITLFRFGWGVGVMSFGYFKSVKFLRIFRPYKYPSMTYNVLDDNIDIVDDNFLVIKRKDFVKRNNSKTGMLFGLTIAPIVVAFFAALVALVADANGVGGFLVVLGGGLVIAFGVLLALDILVMIIELMMRYEVGTKIIEKLANALEYIIDHIPEGNSKYGKYALLGFVGIFLLACIAVAFKYLIMVLGVFIVSSVMMFGFLFLGLVFANAILDWLDEYFAMSAKDNNYGDIPDLLCPKNEDNLRPNYHYIPKKQRTVRLWYHDLKNKVCKPMQQ